MSKIIARRICWPGPDATCLEGGCGYCNLSPFVSIGKIKKYAAGAGYLPHRASGGGDALSVFYKGLANNFWNAEVRYASSRRGPDATEVRDA